MPNIIPFLVLSRSGFLLVGTPFLRSTFWSLLNKGELSATVSFKSLQLLSFTLSVNLA